LGTLIASAAVANMNLAVADATLPTIGRDLEASQTALNLVAVGFTLGLPASGLCLGAVADRYGRYRMLIGGLALSIPAALIAGLARDVQGLALGRLVGGIAAGMAFPTTLRSSRTASPGRRRPGRSRSGPASAAARRPLPRRPRATCSRSGRGAGRS